MSGPAPHLRYPRSYVATFRYFAEPHAYSSYTLEPEACDSCGRRLPGYRGLFYGTRDINFVCEECLARGALAALGQETNEPDIRALRQQLGQLRPELSEPEREELIKERTDELIHRTPAPETWQPFLWPAHCGDYCRFLKEAGKPDLDQLAGGLDGKAFLAASLYGGLQTDVNDLWHSIRADSPKNREGAHDVGVYLYQCLSCGHHIVLWDVN